VPAALQPKDDVDLGMAYFEADERWLLAQFLRDRLNEAGRRFGRPPGKVGVAPEGEA